MTRSQHGFTLIELLIVVAIIAILAAIAVPNFIEAQTRAKISRAQTDMRSIATAIEAYHVDTNKYPIGYLNIRQAVNVGGAPTPPFPTEPTDRNYYSQSFLTTPIAYISSIFIDPFTQGSSFLFDRLDRSEPNGLPFWYDDYQPYSEYFGTAEMGFAYDRFVRIFEAGYRWSISSAGPERSQMMMWYALDGVEPADSNNHIVFAYDPTNGTISEGFIARTNKGVFTEVNQDGS